MARPSKLTPQTVKRLTDAIKLGATYQHASNYAGIAYNTFNEWMKKGAKAKKGQFHEFYDAIKEAEGQAVAKWLAIIEKAGMDGNWQAMAWKLERRYPNDYAKRPPQDHNVAIGTTGKTVEQWKVEEQKRLDAAKESSQIASELYD